MRFVLTAIVPVVISSFVTCVSADSSRDAPVAVPVTSPSASNSPSPSSSAPANKPADGSAPPPSSSGPSSGSKAVRFVAVGDTGTGSSDQLKVASQIAAKCKKDGCDFVQLLGDNIYESGVSSTSDAQWQEKFEVPYAAIDLDFYAVLGNHDYGAGGAGTDFPRGKNEIDYTSVSKKWKMPAASYHFTKGEAGSNVEIFALDTNKAMFGQDADQRQNVPSWIAASTATWKIAVGHHPYLSNGPHGNAGIYDGIPIPPINGSGVKLLLEDTICGKVDLYLCGHDHNRQWLDGTCKGTALAVSGAGAKTSNLPGKNATAFKSPGLGFLYITIQGKTLTADFINDSGSVDFTKVMTKP